MNISLNEQNLIINDYCVNKLSMSKLAKKYKHESMTIRNILTNNNIEIRSNNYYKFKYVDEHYFDTIDSQNKAYILGFIFADGCITRGNVFEIKLSCKDIDLLYDIKQELKSEHHIVIYGYTSGYKSTDDYCSLSIVNKTLYDGLVKSGVTERKTYTLEFPYSVITEDLYSHFIRGFFDGDGSVYSIKQSNTIGCSFTGTYNMLSSIRDITNKVTGSKANVHKYKYKDVYDFKIGGRYKVAKFYRWLYADANMFLKRKRQVFEDVFDTPRKTFNDYNTTSEY